MSRCHANSCRADIAEKFILARLREVILYPEHLTEIVDELNKEIQMHRQPWELEVKELELQKRDTRNKIDKWRSLIETTPELASDLKERINKLEIEHSELNQRNQELTQILDTEGYKISEKDATKVLQLVNSIVQESTPKPIVKAILKSFVDRITFDKDTKDHYKIHMSFNQSVVDKLNDYKNEEPTADTKAVGSFLLSKTIKLYI